MQIIEYFERNGWLVKLNELIKSAINLARDHVPFLYPVYKVLAIIVGFLDDRHFNRKKIESLFMIEPKQLALKPESSPSLFLREEHQIVGFHGRKKELEELIEWACDRSSENVSVALVVGGPGRGKSRLARELCKLVANRDGEAWTARFLKEDPEHKNHGHFKLMMAQSKPLLLIIDYAERRTAQVAELVSVALEAERKDRPVRVLLIARAEGEWFKGIKDKGEFYKHPSNPFGRVKFLELSPIEVEDRAQEFEHALMKFREFLNMDTGGTTNDIPNDLLQEEEVEILDIHIAALLAASGNDKNGDAQQAGSYEERLLGGLMDRERQIWRRHGLEGEEIRSAIAWMAVTDGLTKEEDAFERLRLLPDFRKEKVRRCVAKILRVLYPGNAWWSGVKPDRLVTWMAHEELAGMIKENPEIVTELPNNAFVNLLRHLTWSVQRYESELDKKVLGNVIRAGGRAGIIAATKVGVEVGDPIGSIAAEILSKTKDEEVAREVYGLIGGETVSLRELGLVVAEILYHNAANSGERAQQANNLSHRLFYLGRHEEALAAIEKAVTLHRGLAEARPGAFRPGLAASLNNLSNCLSKLGQYEEALAAIEEAVTIRRELVDIRPDAFRPDLATSLNNLSNHLHNLGHREEALAAIEKAVALHRELAETQPDTFRPDLAMSLNNLSGRLSGLGRREEALAAIEESAAIYRTLAEARPSVFRPNLAMSLNSLSGCLFGLGRREEALAVIKEAVALHHGLAETRPDAFRPDLATSLNNLSNHLSNLGHREEAFAAIEEAVAIRRELAEARPGVFRSDLAMSLNNLSGCLFDLGRREEALTAVEEAAALYRDLAEARPVAFHSDLAGGLNNLSACLSSLGRHEEALATIEEAVALYRELAEARPGMFRSALAGSLNNLSPCLSGLGRREEALVAIEEAVAIRRELAEARPGAFRPDLAGSLNNLSSCLSDLGRLEEALVAIEEAVAIRRELVGILPDMFHPNLVKSLHILHAILFNLGHLEEALVAIEEAVAIRRKLARTLPDVFYSDLVESLRILRATLSALGRQEEALKIVEEVAALRRKQ